MKSLATLVLVVVATLLGIGLSCGAGFSGCRYAPLGKEDQAAPAEADDAPVVYY